MKQERHFVLISKLQEESGKYHLQSVLKSILVQNQRVKKHAKTLFWMFDISNQPKLKLIRSTK